MPLGVILVALICTPHTGTQKRIHDDHNPEGISWNWWAFAIYIPHLVHLIEDADLTAHLGEGPGDALDDLRHRVRGRELQHALQLHTSHRRSRQMSGDAPVNKASSAKKTVTSRGILSEETRHAPSLAKHVLCVCVSPHRPVALPLHHLAARRGLAVQPLVARLQRLIHLHAHHARQHEQP